MKHIRRIIGGYDLNDMIAKSLISDLEDAHLKWWERQASEMSRELLKKELRIRHLEGKNEDKNR